jgi:glycosyltransferase involved in cell wall biosynthesis
MAKYWDIEVLTTCAIDYMTWQDEYPPGLTTVNDICVRRFPVDTPRDVKAFNRLSATVLAGGVGRDAELNWIQTQGPVALALLDYLEQQHHTYDFYIFFTYLYAPTFFGLPLVADRSLLVPTAHDEPPIYLDIFKEFFRLPQALIFNTPEEQSFVNHRFGTIGLPQEVIGVGVEDPSDVNVARFLDRYHDQLEGDDFVLYAGRIDASKGCQQLFSHFMRFREDCPDYRLKLLLIGSKLMEIPAHPDILYLGFVSEPEKFDAIAASQLVILPSPYESLSIVALEAWQLAKPVLASGMCAVLQGQCIRSNGGLWYENYAEFRATLSLLLQQADIRSGLGASGKNFVKSLYTWDRIESKYLQLVNNVLQLR